MGRRNPKSPTGVRLNSAKDWDNWLASFQREATRLDVWAYVDPEVATDPTPAKPVQPPVPPPADCDLARWQAEWAVFRHAHDEWRWAARGLAAAEELLMASVGAHYHRVLAGKPSVHAMMRALAAVAAPDDKWRLDMLRKRYEKALAAGRALARREANGGTLPENDADDGFAALLGDDGQPPPPQQLEARPPLRRVHPFRDPLMRWARTRFLPILASAERIHCVSVAAAAGSKGVAAEEDDDDDDEDVLAPVPWHMMPRCTRRATTLAQAEGGAVVKPAGIRAGHASDDFLDVVGVREPGYLRQRREVLDRVLAGRRELLEFWHADAWDPWQGMAEEDKQAAAHLDMARWCHVYDDPVADFEEYLQRRWDEQEAGDERCRGAAAWHDEAPRRAEEAAALARRDRDEAAERERAVREAEAQGFAVANGGWISCPPDVEGEEQHAMRDMLDRPAEDDRPEDDSDVSLAGSWEEVLPASKSGSPPLGWI